MDQCHAKAHILLKDPIDLKQIDTLYYGKAGKSENSDKPSNAPLKPPGVALRVFGMLCVVLTVLSFAAGMSVGIYSSSKGKSPLTFDINPTALTESSALESDKSLVLVSEIRESYYLSVAFSSNQDAEIGNYVEDDYLYHAFGGITNKFTATIDIYNSETNTLFHDYHSLDIELRKGNKTYNSKISSLDIETNRNVVTYSYADDIYIYSLNVVVNFEGLGVLGSVGVALIMLSFLGFLPLAIALNVVASVRNKKYKNYISNSSLGREEYIRRQEEAEKRRKNSG